MADTRTVVIAGKEFTLRTPYAEGHVLTAPEAKQLNQVRCENIANNFRKQVKEIVDANGDLTEITQKLADYDAVYDFSAATGGTSAPKLDPVEREARAIAKELIKNHLAKQGRKLSDVPEGRTKEEHEELVEQKIVETAAKPEVMAAAKKRVEAKKKSLDALAGTVEL